jgi:hypothetical protein
MERTRTNVYAHSVEFGKFHDSVCRVVFGGRVRDTCCFREGHPDTLRAVRFATDSARVLGINI